MSQTLAFMSLPDVDVVHCDLKPENILFRVPNRSAVKVVDFGSSCKRTEQMYVYIQSRFYRSPEVILGLPYEQSIDMWSLGCILFELHVGLPLFPGRDEMDQMHRFVKLKGLPPRHMLARGRKTSNFFEKEERKEYTTSKLRSRRERWWNRSKRSIRQRLVPKEAAAQSEHTAGCPDYLKDDHLGPSSADSVWEVSPTKPPVGFERAPEPPEPPTTYHAYPTRAVSQAEIDQARQDAAQRKARAQQQKEEGRPTASNAAASGAAKSGTAEKGTRAEAGDEGGRGAAAAAGGGGRARGGEAAAAGAAGAAAAGGGGGGGAARGGSGKGSDRRDRRGVPSGDTGLRLLGKIDRRWEVHDADVSDASDGVFEEERSVPKACFDVTATASDIAFTSARAKDAGESGDGNGNEPMADDGAERASAGEGGDNEEDQAADADDEAAAARVQERREALRRYRQEHPEAAREFVRRRRRLRRGFLQSRPFPDSYRLKPRNPSNRQESKVVSDLREALGVYTKGPEGRRATETEGHSEESYKRFVDLIECMLEWDPRVRIKPLQALNHPFLREDIAGPPTATPPVVSPGSSEPGTGATSTAASRAAAAASNRPPSRHEGTVSGFESRAVSSATQEGEASRASRRAPPSQQAKKQEGQMQDE